jgi:DNA repair ATPase RecN
VTVDLLLHTAIIALLSVLLSRGEMTAPGIAIAAVLAAAAVGITVYTGHRIVRSVNESIDDRVKNLAEFSDGLMEVSTMLDQYSKRLDERAGRMEDWRKELSRNVNLLSAYGSLMLELNKTADAIKESAALAEMADSEESGESAT